MSARRAVLLTVAFQLPVAAIIAVGFITDHVGVAIIVVVALLALGGFAANAVWVRRAKARTSEG